MNNKFKKVYLEAIDGVLDIINEAGTELDKENKAFKYELKKLENSVLGLKVAFFETYYAEKGDDLTEEEECDKKEEPDKKFEIEDDGNDLIIDWKKITAETTEKIKSLLKEYPPVMTEEKFDNESRRAQEKNPIAD